MQKEIYLIDASIYIFRAWFSLPDTLKSVDDAPVNAVYGFLRFVTEFVERVKPTHIIFAFDGSLTTSFRNEIYPEYKANREKPPVELKQQFQICQEFVEALGMNNLVDVRYEADDLIATIAAHMRVNGYRNVVVTADKDLTQVLSHGDIWWDYMRDRKLDVDGVHERFGVWPHQVHDYLALMGDTVDNIPGVPGIGPKSAARLLRLYPDLETLYENIEQVPQLAIRGAGRMASNLKSHRDQVFLARRLTTTYADVPLRSDVDEYCVKQRDESELSRLVQWIDRGDGFVERIKHALKV